MAHFNTCKIGLFARLRRMRRGQDCGPGVPPSTA